VSGLQEDIAATMETRSRLEDRPRFRRCGRLLRSCPRCLGDYEASAQKAAVGMAGSSLRRELDTACRRGCTLRPTSVHHMRAHYIIFCLIWGLRGASAQPKETFTYRGYLYRLAVNFEVWKSLPFWDSQKGKTPPVSASRAVKEAFKFMSKLEC